MSGFTVQVDRGKGRVEFDYMSDDQLASHVTAYTSHEVAAVHVKRYSSRMFGPEADIALVDGRRLWISFPGGMAHSGWYTCASRKPHCAWPAVDGDYCPDHGPADTSPAV